MFTHTRTLISTRTRTMEPLVAYVHRNSDPDQSAQILHPKRLFPWAQRARAHTHRTRLRVLVRAWISPRLIHHSITTARPNLGLSLSLHATNLSLSAFTSKTERKSQKPARQKTNCAPHKYPHDQVRAHTPFHAHTPFLSLVTSGLV